MKESCHLKLYFHWSIYIKQIFFSSSLQAPLSKIGLESRCSCQTCLLAIAFSMLLGPGLQRWTITHAGINGICTCRIPGCCGLHPWKLSAMPLLWNELCWAVKRKKWESLDYKTSDFFPLFEFSVAQNDIIWSSVPTVVVFDKSGVCENNNCHF